MSFAQFGLNFEDFKGRILNKPINPKMGNIKDVVEEDDTYYPLCFKIVYESGKFEVYVIINEGGKVEFKKIIVGENANINENIMDDEKEI